MNDDMRNKWISRAVILKENLQNIAHLAFKNIQ